MKEATEKKCGTYVDVKSSNLSIGEGFIVWKWTHHLAKRKAVRLSLARTKVRAKEARSPKS